MQLLGELAVGLLVLERVLEVVPQLEEREEIGALVVEPRVRLIGGVGALERALARVLNFERRGDDQCLGHAMLLARREDDARDARVDREPGELPANLGEFVARVDRPQLGEQLIAVGDHARAWGFEKREVLDVAYPERLHAQDHARQRRAQDLGVGEFRARMVIVFAVKADAHAGRHAPAAPGALVGRRARNVFGLQLLDLVAVAVAVDARQARVDHVADAGHGQRGLGDIGGEHDAARAGRPEHALLLLERQARVQRQDFSTLRVVLAQHFGGLADLAFARQKNQDVSPTRLARQFVHRIDDGLPRLFFLVIVHGWRPVTHFDRIKPSRHLDDRRRRTRMREVPGEALRIDGRGRHDQLQVRPLRQQALQVPEQEVDVEAALVRLVDDQRVVAAQQPVALRFRKQDAVGHHLDIGVPRDLVGKTHLVADRMAEQALQFLCNARCNRARRDPARLGMADQSRHAAFEVEADLGQLCCLPRTGFAAHDHDLVRRDRLRNLVAPGDHRKVVGIGWARKVGKPPREIVSVKSGHKVADQHLVRGRNFPRAFSISAVEVDFNDHAPKIE